MSIALQARVTALEVEVRALKSLVEAMQQAPAPTPEDVERKPIAKLCPKCGEQPAYFFHVKNCKGPK